MLMICQASKEQLSRLGGSQTFLSLLLSFFFMKCVNNKFRFFLTSCHTIKYGLEWSGVKWICKTWSECVKGGFVKHGFVKGSFVKRGFVKGGFVNHGFVKK